MVAEHGRPRLAEHIVDVLVPLITEEIVEVLKTVFQEQISERICKQIVEQTAEVPKTSSRDRTLQRAAEQILDVPLPEMVTQLVEVPETVSQDRIQQRTVEQIVDAPVPQVVEELAESFKVFSQDRIQQRAVEQTIEIPAVSLDEKIIEVPVARTPEKAQQVANTLVQHDVNTVEVERSKLVKEIVQEKINQATKHAKVPRVCAVKKTAEIPQVQFLDKVDEIPVVAQRQILMVQTVQKTMEIPQLQCVDKVVDNPEAPQVQVSEKTVEISHLQAAEKIVDTRETQTIQCIQTSESLVHLTCAMKPDDPDARIKFLAEEELCGVGDPVFDANGNRVANELGGQNFVTGEMWKNEPPLNLSLNQATSDDIAWQRKQYTGRGIRKLQESGTALAEGTEAPVPKMPDSIEAHCQASLKSAKDPQTQSIVKELKSKFEVGHTNKVHARNQPDKNRWRKKQEFEATQYPQDVQERADLTNQRQVPAIRSVQKTVEVPRVQYIDKVADIPVDMQRQLSTTQAAQDIDEVEDVPARFRHPGR